MFRKRDNGARVGPVVSAGALIGAGMGGFVDGIVLHQILQWHNMLSNRIPPTDLVSIKVNMVYDGLFHALTWLMTLTGILLLWRAAGLPKVVRSWRALGGSLLLGWGLFNVVEGVIDHQWLGLHHVRPGPGYLAWDIGFIALGAVMMAVGVASIASAARAHGTRAASQPAGAELAESRS